MPRPSRTCAIKKSYAESDEFSSEGKGGFSSIQKAIEETIEIEIGTISSAAPPKRRRIAKKVTAIQVQSKKRMVVGDDGAGSLAPPKKKRTVGGEASNDGTGPPAPAKKKRIRTVKKTDAPSDGMLPLAPRTIGMKMLVGAHVSMAKGVHNAIQNSHHIGGNAFALFLKQHRKWKSPDMEESDAAAFRNGCQKAGIDPRRHILPHGSYLVNLAQTDEEKAKMSYDTFVDDLKRCERLQIGLYNFHPGSTLGNPRPAALARVADRINHAHKETKYVKVLLENMAGQGNIIGANFEDLRDIIQQVEDKDRIGVCLDTCHLFAAGHDIRTQASYDLVMSNFHRIVGQKYLAALHLNDSKTLFGSNRDRHENIGLGYLGLEPFRIIMNDKRLEGLPMILETPPVDPQTWAVEIKLLESLVGTSADDTGFLAKASKLSEQGLVLREQVLLTKLTGDIGKAGKKAKAKVKKTEESDSEDENNHQH